jgi:uncharacterized protein DUF885
MGELAIVRAREKAEKTLGAKFNIRAFHDAVLELGSVPLPVVTARIDRFIAEDGKGPYPDMERVGSNLRQRFCRLPFSFCLRTSALLRDSDKVSELMNRHRGSDTPLGSPVCLKLADRMGTVAKAVRTGVSFWSRNKTRPLRNTHAGQRACRLVHSA